MLISLLTRQKRVVGSPALLPGSQFEEGDALPAPPVRAEGAPARGGSGKSPGSGRLIAEHPGSYPAPTWPRFPALGRPRHTMLSGRSHFWSLLHRK